MSRSISLLIDRSKSTILHYPSIHFTCTLCWFFEQSFSSWYQDSRSYYPRTLIMAFCLLEFRFYGCHNYESVHQVHVVTCHLAVFFDSSSHTDSLPLSNGAAKDQIAISIVGQISNNVQIFLGGYQQNSGTRSGGRAWNHGFCN